MIIKDYFFGKVNEVGIKDGYTFINEFITMLRNSKNKEFRNIAKTFINWKKEIVHSFIKHNNKSLTNGGIEGLNNFIKTVKKVSYGFRNFERFRNKVIYLYNKDYCLRG